MKSIKSIYCICIAMMLVTCILQRDARADLRTGRQDKKWSGIPFALGDHSFSTSDSLGGEVICWDDTGHKVRGQIINSRGLIKFDAGRFATAKEEGGILMASNSHIQTNSLVATDSAGGFFGIWQDTYSGVLSVYVQHISNSGYRSYGTNGISLIDASLIGTTGIPLGYWITPTDRYHAIAVVGVSSSFGSAGNIFAIALDTGGVVWVKRITYNNVSYNPFVVNDGQGGGVIGWNKNGGMGQSDVYAQMVSSAGAVAWSDTVNGEPVLNTSASEILSRFQVTCRDTHSDPVFVVSIPYPGIPGQFTYKAVQLARSNGAVNWATLFPYSLTGNRAQASAVPEDSGGIYVAVNWHSGATNSDQCSVLFVKHNGSFPWSTTIGNSMATANTPATNITVEEPRIVRDRNNGSIAAWIGHTTGVAGVPPRSVCAARVNDTGGVQWVNGGNGLSLFDTTNTLVQELTAASDSGGGIIVLYRRVEGTGSSTSTLFSQHAADNHLVWSNDQIAGTDRMEFGAPVLVDLGATYTRPRFSVVWGTVLDTSTHAGVVRQKMLSSTGVPYYTTCNIRGDSIPGSTNFITDASQCSWCNFPTYAPSGPDAVGDTATGGDVITWSGLSSGLPEVFVEDLTTTGYGWSTHHVQTPGSTVIPASPPFPAGFGTIGRYEPVITRSRDRLTNSDNFWVAWIEQVYDSTDITGGVAHNSMSDFVVMLQGFNGSNGNRLNLTPFIMSGRPCIDAVWHDYVDYPQICSDGNGGAWVSWYNGSTQPPSFQARHQSSGRPVPDFDIVTVSSPNPTMMFCNWPFYFPTAYPLQPYDIYQHRIASDGGAYADDSVWHPGSPGYWSCTWHDGGCYVAFSATDTATANGQNIYLSHVLDQANASSMSTLWLTGCDHCDASPGHRRSFYRTDAVCDTTGTQYDPRVATYPTPLNTFIAYVSWTDARVDSTIHVYAQSPSSDVFGAAVRRWSPYQGVRVSDSVNLHNSINMNGNIAVTTDTDAVLLWVNVVDEQIAPWNSVIASARLFHNDGSRMWGARDVAVSSTDTAMRTLSAHTITMQGLNQLVVGTDGAIVATWSDWRLSYNSDTTPSSSIYAQRLTNDSGYFAKQALPRQNTPTRFDIATVYPDPAAGNATLAFTFGSPASNVMVRIVDMLGREVQHVQLGQVQLGDYVLPINGGMLRTGMYVAQLVFDGGVLNTHFAVVK